MVATCSFIFNFILSQTAYSIEGTIENPTWTFPKAFFRRMFFIFFYFTVSSKMSNRHKVCLESGKCLVLGKQQAIIWTKDDLVYEDIFRVGSRFAPSQWETALHLSLAGCKPRIIPDIHHQVSVTYQPTGTFIMPTIFIWYLRIVAKMQWTMHK